MIWAFAGVICTIGAFAYAELGTMFPESGGDYQYLARAYGKKMALVFGWSFITILNPIGTAGIAGVLGRYSVDVIKYLETGNSAGIGGANPAGSIDYAQQFNATSILNGTGYYVPHIHSPYAPGTAAYDAFPKDPLPRDHTGAVLPNVPHADDMPWVVRGFSIGAIVAMGLINIFFKEGGKYASNTLAIFKIAGMCMLIVIGSMQAIKNHAQSEALSIPIEESSQNVLDYVSALCFAFFAYNGFNNINLGLGELRDPERNLKRAVWIAMPFVTVLFLLANFAFFSILSSYDLRHVHSLSLHAGHTVLGKTGGFLMAGTVIASALGSINANIWAGSRLLVIMAKDNAIVPFPVGKVWARTGTQAIAIAILVGQAAVHALINLDFKTFSKIYSAVGWSWYGLSVLGLLWLRKKKPAFPRPVKVFWPLAVGFVMVAFFLVFGSLTLAFLSSSQEQQQEQQSGGQEQDGGQGGGRYASVIMFGMAILFMLGVIPAFYLTRCYNRRRGFRRAVGQDLAQNSSAEHGHHRDNGRDKSDGDYGGHDCSGNASSRDGAQYGTYLGCIPGHMERKNGLEIQDDEKLARHHSSTSSMTLVSNTKRRAQRTSNSHHQSLSLDTQRQHQPDRACKRQDDHCVQDEDDADDEEVTARFQALRSASCTIQDDIELGNVAVTGATNMTNTYFSPSELSGGCISPKSAALRSMVATSPNDSYGESPCFLDTPHTLHNLRPSESILNLEEDFQYEKSDTCATDYHLSREVRRDSIEKMDLKSRFYLLDLPLAESSCSNSATAYSHQDQAQQSETLTSGSDTNDGERGPAIATMPPHISEENS
ncbi:hypothetical protein BGZ98_007776 [Dissophora globulifera]|nr:hypothetical protein BGZ98_007776 [Dissophora globulifera]